MELPQDERPAQTNRQGDAPFQNGFSKTSDVCGNKLTRFNNKENYRAKTRKCKPNSEWKPGSVFVIPLAPPFSAWSHPNIDLIICPKESVGKTLLSVLRVFLVHLLLSKSNTETRSLTEPTRRDSVFPADFFRQVLTTVRCPEIDPLPEEKHPPQSLEAARMNS